MTCRKMASGGYGWNGSATIATSFLPCGARCKSSTRISAPPRTNGITLPLRAETHADLPFSPRKGEMSGTTLTLRSTRDSQYEAVVANSPMEECVAYLHLPRSLEFPGELDYSGGPSRRVIADEAPNIRRFMHGCIRFTAAPARLVTDPRRN